VSRIITTDCAPRGYLSRRSFTEDGSQAKTNRSLNNKLSALSFF